MFTRFEKIYSIQAGGNAFERPDDLLKWVDLYDLTQKSMQQHLVVSSGILSCTGPAAWHGGLHWMCDSGGLRNQISEITNSTGFLRPIHSSVITHLHLSLFIPRNCSRQAGANLSYCCAHYAQTMLTRQGGWVVSLALVPDCHTRALRLLTTSVMEAYEIAATDNPQPCL